MSKQRLDQLLADRGLVESRQRAKALIMAGRVLVDERKIDKPGFGVRDDAVIRLLGPDHPFVSRGGVKLDHALKTFAVSARDAICLDVGASTGGFTDCLLQAGAKKVYAVDVGYGQLAEKLRTDARVINIERTNIRSMARERVPEPIDLCVIDASFISLKLVLPAALPLVRAGGQVIALVKPQFEVGKDKVEKGGVVRSADERARVLDEITTLGQELGCALRGTTESPIAGAKSGNVELLACFQR